MTVRVVALGSEFGGDDRAALEVARALEPEEGVEVILAGRPGPGLIDHFEDGVPLVLLDVVRRGLAPGRVLDISLDELGARGLSSGAMGSHDLGPVDALQLAAALGRTPPSGVFVGLGGACFLPSDRLSGEVSRALPSFASAVRAAISRMVATEAERDA